VGSQLPRRRQCWGLFAQSKLVVEAVAVEEKQFTLRFHLERAQQVQMA
jgi:hypothetical protein